jgi:hypothetical protein
LSRLAAGRSWRIHEFRRSNSPANTIQTALRAPLNDKSLMKRSSVLIATILVVFSTLSISLSTTARIKATAQAGAEQDPTVSDSKQSRQSRSLEDFDIRANIARSLPTVEDQARLPIKPPSRATGVRLSKLLRERPNTRSN